MSAIEKLYKTWKAMQPIKEEYRKALDRKFMLDFNFNSNHIEGNTLTYGQTKLMLLFGETEGSAKLRDYEEMKAHNVGLELVKTEAQDKERPLTENFIRTLNKTILVENFTKYIETDNSSQRYTIHVGQYKTRPNSVETATGETFEYASPEETPALMSDLVKWFNEEDGKGELSLIELAALFHYRYIRIHPFEDGNGRIARLLVNYILLRHDYPMIVIPSSDKHNYLSALRQCDINTGDNTSATAHSTIDQIRPFTEYLEGLLEYALDLSIRAGEGENISTIK
jgi:Fic family protein